MDSADSHRKPRKGTESSEFGVSKREGHDSSKYYNSRLYENVPKESDVGDPVEFPESLLDKLFCQDARDMSQIPSNSIQAMISDKSIEIKHEGKWIVFKFIQ